jgi:hypothetical protein
VKPAVVNAVVIVLLRVGDLGLSRGIGALD